MAVKTAVAAFLLLASTGISAAPLTVKTGESWTFSVRNGDPINARKVAGAAKPAKGQIMVSVRRLMGTSMIVTNNSGSAYVFRAEILKGGKALTGKSCTLPAKPDPIFEQWKEEADAVRISQFKPAPKDGSCP